MRTHIGRVAARGVALGVVVMISAGCTALAAARVAQYRPNGVARDAPTVQLEQVGVEGFRGILVGLRGRPVLVNLWASWCGPCQAEAPLLRDAARQRGGDVTFIGVNVRDSVGDAKKFIARHRLAFVSIADPDGDIADELRNRGLPGTYLFGADGTLRATITGGLTEQVLAGHLDDLVRP